MTKRRSDRNVTSRADGQKKIRADRWLWVARFYKTRSLASEALKGGKINADGNKIKPSKELQIGEMLTIKKVYEEKTVKIVALSDKRGPATQAQMLYQETEDSILKRQRQKDLRVASAAIRSPGDGRPTKRERRKIIKFTSNV